MILDTFNTQCFIMQHMISYNIQDNKIKITDYQNYCESTVKHDNIVYLQNWETVKKNNEEVKMIFRKMMTADFTKRWSYVFYSHMISQKYLKTALLIAEKCLQFNNYNIIKTYCWFKQIIDDIKTQAMMMNNIISLLIVKINTAVIKITSISVFNITAVKAATNAHLMTMLKLQNALSLKLCKNMKNIIKDEEIKNK